MNKIRSSKAMDYTRVIIINIIVLSLLLVITEGLSSYVMIVRDIMTAPSLAERRHTIYDSQLGWVNEPDVHIPNMYGSGVSLKINSQGIRSPYDFDAATTAGKLRIICSGDSFTFGFGVGDDHTWGRRLESLDPRLETINMGQGGYGVGQAYLWYKRDGGQFEHQFQLLAFISDDFRRMQRDSFLGYGKPKVEAADNALIVKNVPVPRWAYYLSWFVDRARVEAPATLQLTDRVMQKLRSKQAAKVVAEESTEEDPERETQSQKLLGMIFEDLKRLNEQRESQLILMYLPTLYELKGKIPQQWMQFVEDRARMLGILFINVFSVFQDLPPEEAEAMFIPSGQMNFTGAAGHFNNQGNAFVAEIIYEQLKPYLANVQAFTIDQDK